MKIQDLVKDWQSLSRSGTCAGMDRTTDSLNPTTTIIEDVQEWRNNKDNTILGIVVTVKKDNRPVSETLTVRLHLRADQHLHLSPEQPIFHRLVKALKSAIGKTLSDAGNIAV